MNNTFSEDDSFSVISKFFRENGLAKHQFDSYENMVKNLLPKIINETVSIKLNLEQCFYKVSFTNCYVEKASYINEHNKIINILPKQARLKDLTYDSPVSVDIIEELYEKVIGDDGEESLKKINSNIHQKIILMRIPVMVRSSKCNLHGMSEHELIEAGECTNDIGGYFIINGNERAMICQERLNYNQIYCFHQSGITKFPYVAEIRSYSEETAHSVAICCKMTKEHNTIVFELPYLSKEVHACAVFRALGFSDEQIILLINPDTPQEYSIVRRMIKECKQYKTEEECIKYLADNLQKIEDDQNRKILTICQILDNEIFPHLGLSTVVEKGILLADMLNKMIKTGLGTRKYDDRDNISIKRIDTIGSLFIDLIRMSLKRYTDTLKKTLMKRQDILSAMSRISNTVTSSLHRACSTGNWTAQKTAYVRVGVCQIITRLSFPAFLSHLRRVVIPADKESKNVKIRQIDPSQVFFVDVIESPEGGNIALKLNKKF